MRNMDLEGTIFNIQKFSIHDGMGIRTLIFMKGCPLKCIWCSNPESQRYEKEIMFVEKQCTSCGKCVSVCPCNCINLKSFQIEREKCNLCGKCVKVCYSNGKKILGDKKSVSQVIGEIEKDRIFYLNSGGGVTIGGGEPTVQAEFVVALLSECKRLSIHTAIESCAYGQWEKISEIFHIVDQIFIDIKHMDNDTHKKITGVENISILKNAKKISKLNKDITFRIPLIPGLNDSEKNLKDTGEFVKSLMTSQNNIKLELLPYHALGNDKYKGLDMDYSLKKLKPPSAKNLEYFNKILKEIGCKVLM